MTAIAHDSAWLACLTVDQLQSELALAASRLACVHLVEARNGWPAVCHECGATHKDDLLSIQHGEDCRTGAVARVLYALASAGCGRVLDLYTTSTRKETRAPIDHSTEPSSKPGNTAERGAAAGEMRPRPFLVTHTALPGHYAEPWAMDDGEVIDSNCNTIVDPHGCTLAEPDDADVMARIVVCVNYCAGIPTMQLVASGIGGVQ